MKKVLVAVLAVSGAAIAYAHAETGEGRAERGEFRSQMRALIAGDGMEVVDLTNLMLERSQARFEALDADGDGEVTREEFLAASGERAERMFERMGPDEDGVVTRSGREGGPRHHRGPHGERHGGEDRAERLATRAAEEFARLDADGDGMISPTEYEAGLQARAERMEERRGERAERRGERGERRGGPRFAMHGGPRGEVPEEMRRMHGELRALMRDGMDLDAFSGLMETRAEARFDALDADGDGSLTAAEFVAGVPERAEAVFARMDRNSDGVVSRDDRPRWGGRDRGPREDRTAD